MSGGLVRGYHTMGRLDAETGPLVNQEYDYGGLGRVAEARDCDPNLPAPAPLRNPPPQQNQTLWG